MIYFNDLRFFREKSVADTTGGAIKSAIMSNQQLAEESRKLKSRLKPNKIWEDR